MAACDLPEGYVSRGRRGRDEESGGPSTSSPLDDMSQAKTIMEDPEKMKDILRTIEKDDSIISDAVNVMETNPTLKRKAMKIGRNTGAKEQLEAMSQKDKRKLIKKVKAAQRGVVGGPSPVGLSCQIVGVSPARKFKHVKVRPEFLELEPWKNWNKVVLEDNCFAIYDPEDKTENRLAAKILGKKAGHSLLIYGIDSEGKVFCPEISKLEGKYKR